MSFYVYTDSASGVDYYYMAAPPKPKPSPKQRALELLESHLTPEQLAQFHKRGWFEVRGGSTGRRYRIYTNRVINNTRRRWGPLSITAYCATLAERLQYMPKWDHILGQKLMLENHERHFLREANATRFWILQLGIAAWVTAMIAMTLKWGLVSLALLVMSAIGAAIFVFA